MGGYILFVKSWGSDEATMVVDFGSKPEFPVTVGDLKKFLSEIPDDMPVFRVNDYWGECEPLGEECLPEEDQVSELEFSHGRSFHSGSRDGLVDHKVLRTFDVLAIW